MRRTAQLLYQLVLFNGTELWYYDKNTKGELMKSTKFWVVMIAAVLFLSVCASAFVLMYHGTGHTVSISQNGKVIKRINLDTVTTPYEFTVKGEGGSNTVRVEQGRICVVDATCPDHVCVNTGWISDGAIPIVCLPNQLVIQAETSDTQVDGNVQ